MLGIGKFGRAGLLVVAGAIGGGAAFAVASVPDANNVIHACYQVTTSSGTVAPSPANGNIRIIDPAAGQSCSPGVPGQVPAESALNWNVTGPAGPAGPAGPTGAAGGTGAAGSPGASVTIPAGNTLTLPGGGVVRVGNIAGTVAPLPLHLTPRGVGTVTFGSGSSAITSTIESFAAAAKNNIGSQSTGAGAGKVAFNPFTITRKVDKSSPTLQKLCVSGKHFASVTITVRLTKGKLTYKLSDVIISSYQLATTGAGNQPVESLSLSYTKYEVSET
jgi:type VI protein secretion system component Hcp